MSRLEEIQAANAAVDRVLGQSTTPDYSLKAMPERSKAKLGLRCRHGNYPVSCAVCLQSACEHSTFQYDCMDCADGLNKPTGSQTEMPHG